MNCCKPEQVGTNEYGKMLKRIQVLEDSRIPAREARNWKIEGQKRRITRKGYKRLWNESETRGFMAQKGLWNLDTAAPPKCKRRLGKQHHQKGDWESSTTHKREGESSTTERRGGGKQHHPKKERG